MSDLVNYKKYYIARDPITLGLKVVDEKPVLGEFIRNARISDSMADELNQNWSNSGFIWARQSEKQNISQKTESSDDMSKNLIKSDAEIDEMFLSMSKAKILDMYEIPYDKAKLNLVKVPAVKDMVKEKINELKGE